MQSLPYVPGYAPHKPGNMRFFIRLNFPVRANKVELGDGTWVHAFVVETEPVLRYVESLFLRGGGDRTGNVLSLREFRRVEAINGQSIIEWYHTYIQQH